MQCACGHQLGGPGADDGQEAVGHELERGRASQVADVLDLAELLEDRPRRLQILDSRRAREDDQRSAVDGRNAAHHRRLDQLRAVLPGGGCELLHDARPGRAHLDDGLPGRGFENAARSEIDLPHGRRAGNHRDHHLRLPRSRGRRIGDEPDAHRFGLAPRPVPDRNLEAACLEAAGDRSPHPSRSEHCHLGHGALSFRGRVGERRVEAARIGRSARSRRRRAVH